MHWDGTVTLGNLLTIFSGGIAFLVFYAKIVRLLAVMSEYPPHRHDDESGITFPRGMKPER